jgi:hypothetical protein
MVVYILTRLGRRVATIVPTIHVVLLREVFCLMRRLVPAIAGDLLSIVIAERMELQRKA